MDIVHLSRSVYVTRLCWATGVPLAPIWIRPPWCGPFKAPIERLCKTKILATLHHPRFQSDFNVGPFHPFLTIFNPTSTVSFFSTVFNPMSTITFLEMQGGIYLYTYRPQSLVAVSGGSTYPWEQDSAAYFHNPQIRDSEDVGSLVSCGAPPGCQLKSIFRHIPLAPQTIHSCSMIRKLTSFGHDTMRASNLRLRYAGTLNLLKHAYLM
jgi:hypothetical protein